jgi:type IV secretion system protein VirB10
MRCVQAGTLVKAVLATAIDSSVPGMIVAQVSHPVWDPTLTRIVIPAGSKLLGEYGAGLEPGQTRAEVAWTRLILTTGESVELGRFPGASPGGASGVSGEVDERWDRLLSGAALSGAFAASAAALAGPVDGFSVDPRRQAITGAARPLQELGEQRARTQLSTGPVLRVPVGARVGMLVPLDLLLPTRPGGGLNREGRRL